MSKKFCSISDFQIQPRIDSPNILTNSESYHSFFFSHLLDDWETEETPSGTALGASITIPTHHTEPERHNTIPSPLAAEAGIPPPAESDVPLPAETGIDYKLEQVKLTDDTSVKSDNTDILPQKSDIPDTASSNTLTDSVDNSKPAADKLTEERGQGNGERQTVSTSGADDESETAMQEVKLSVDEGKPSEGGK